MGFEPTTSGSAGLRSLIDALIHARLRALQLCEFPVNKRLISLYMNSATELLRMYKVYKPDQRPTHNWSLATHD